MRARQTPITDAVADTAWDGASDDYSAYAKMLKNARELEEKLAATTKQRDELLDALESACAYPLTDSWFEKAQTAIAEVKGGTP